MSEPKLTVGRVETWRPIDEVKAMDAGTWWLARQINSRMAALFPPAPQPEAKAEPDYTCPKCGKDCWDGVCTHDWAQTLAAANARIAELVRERDEARAKPRDCATCWDSGYRSGVDAAKEACARRFLDEADAHSNDGNPIWFTLSQMSARLVRETEVPGP